MPELIISSDEVLEVVRKIDAAVDGSKVGCVIAGALLFAIEVAKDSGMPREELMKLLASGWDCAVPGKGRVQ